MSRMDSYRKEMEEPPSKSYDNIQFTKIYNPPVGIKYDKK